MATNPANITSAVRARVYLAPVGTIAPVDASSTPASPWVDVGLTVPDSLTMNTEPEIEPVASHQSDYPTRRLQNADAATISVSLQEWKGTNFIEVFGGGDIVETEPGVSGVWKYTPPAIGGRKEVAALVDVIDGAKRYRIVVPRGMQVEGVELNLNKGSAAVLPLSLEVLGGDEEDPWYILTNSAAFDPSGGA